jgi:hypothetical protein
VVARNLSTIREDLRSYLDMAARFAAVGRHDLAAEYARHAEAMEREMNLLREPKEVLI